VRLERSAATAVILGLLVTACTGQGTPNASPTPAAPSAAASGPPASGEGGTVVVGAGLALTGAMAPFDVPALNGLKLGIKEINAAGGIDGKWKIELRVEDMKTDAAVGAQVGQSLVTGGANIVVVPCDQDPALSVAQAPARAGIPTFSSCAGSATLPNAAGDSVFITAMGNNEQGAALADYAYNTAGYRNAYVMVTHDFSFGLTTPRYFAKAFEALGGKVVAEDNFKILSGDFSAQIAKIRNLNPAPDVIEMSGFVPDPPTFVKQLRAAGVNIPVLGTDGSDSPILLQVGGSQVEGFVFSTHAFPVAGSSVATFYEKYKAEYGTDPESSFTAVGYDLSQVIAAGVTLAKSTDPKALIDAFNNLENVQGATGPITYKGRTRVPLKAVALVKVENGKLTLIKSYVPDPALIPAPSSIDQ
jgi:branched-chain amino acid transport system substrate-binding protein